MDTKHWDWTQRPPRCGNLVSFIQTEVWGETGSSKEKSDFWASGNPFASLGSFLQGQEQGQPSPLDASLSSKISICKVEAFIFATQMRNSLVFLKRN